MHTQFIFKTHQLLSVFAFAFMCVRIYMKLIIEKGNSDYDI